MALSADREVVVSGRTEILHGKLTESVTYYKGGMVQIDKVTGLVKKATDVTVERAIGVLKAGKVVGAGENPDCEIEIGKVWIPLATGAQTDVDGFVWASDDAVIVVSAPTNADPCGRCVDYKLWGNSTTDKRLLLDFRQGLPKTALS